MFPPGGKIELGKTYFHRGDDAKEYILPGSIPEAKFTLDDAEEHDCLPPLEALTTQGWTLSDRLVEKLMEAIEACEKENEKLPKTVLIKTVNDFSQELEAEGIIQPPAIIEHNRNTREWRKAIRWNERNRKRRLKGLPEKPNPHPRAFCFTYVLNLTPVDPPEMSFEWK